MVTTISDQNDESTKGCPEEAQPDHASEVIDKDDLLYWSNDHTKNSKIERASDLLVAVSACAETHKSKIINLAFSATEELKIMAHEKEPLWTFDTHTSSYVINAAEYKKRFASSDPMLEVILRVITQEDPSDLQSFKCQSENGSLCATENMDSQASRANGVVFGDPISIVNMLIDVEKWAAIFSNIVSKAINLAVLSPANQKSPNGCLQVMVAEFQIPSPLVKSQEMYLVRCSRQLDINTWVVADVSLETVIPYPAMTCRRNPSGCVIQALQHGLSYVTWVEHNAECNKDVVHRMFKRLLSSGFPFNAKRWLSALERECDRAATLEAHNVSAYDKGIEAARNCLLKLGGRMMKHFNTNTCSNLESAWTPLPLPGGEEILIKTCLNQDHPHIPPSLTVATSVCLPVEHNLVFSFLRNEHNRDKWDILSHGLQIQDLMRISSSRNSTDCISVVSVEGSSTRRGTTYVQESFSDSMAHYIAYAPVDVGSMQHILQGGGADAVAILPSGFVVLSDGAFSILTVAFQMVDEHLSTSEGLPPHSLLIAYSLIKETLSRICSALISDKINQQFP